VLPALCTEIPGPHSRDLAAELRRYECRNLSGSNSIVWSRASGTNVWDADDNRFLDFNSAFGVSGLGHGHESLRDALGRQAQQLLHAMGDVYPSDRKAALCRKLSEITFERWGAGSGKTILGNSGFESVEAALKTSFLFSGKPGVIAFTGAYHGLGYGALETGGMPKFREPFRRQLKEFATLVPYPYCCRCPFGIREEFRLEGETFPNCSSHCLEKIDAEIRAAIRQREIGAILVEPCQGRGGQIIPSRDFLPLLRRICDEEKILLIADEIYTGFYRTGRFFACEHTGTVPDIICLGKALTGGVPLSACVGRRDVMDAWPESDGEALHTSTFLGNPLGCAMALASLAEYSQPDFGTRVRNSSAILKRALNQLRSPAIVNIRGLGLMFGIEVASASIANSVVASALRDGIILLTEAVAGNVIAVAPPFAVSEEEINFVAARLQEYLISLPGSIS
jgi:4-aminobutyrate aminotransferase-like enzyme